MVHFLCTILYLALIAYHRVFTIRVIKLNKCVFNFGTIQIFYLLNYLL